MSEETENSMDKFMNESITISRKEIVLLVKAAVSYWEIHNNWKKASRDGNMYGLTLDGLFNPITDRLRSFADKLGLYLNYFMFRKNVFCNNVKELTDDYIKESYI